MVSLPKFISKSSFLILIGISTGTIVQTCTRKITEPKVATIGDHNITFSSYKNRYKEFLQSTGFRDNLQFRHMFLQTLIDEYLLLEWADTTGLIDNRSHQQNMKDIDEQILLNKLYETQIKAKIDFSEQELRQLYKWSKSRIHVRHLFTRDATLAESLYERLMAGEKWETLAKEVFKDPVLANNGGDLGFFELGDMDPAFEAVAFQLKNGEISPPVKTRKGFSIIQVIEREYDPFLTEEEFQIKKSTLKRIGFTHKKHPKIKAYTDSVQSSLNIQFFDEGVSQIWEQTEKISTTANEIPIDGASLPCVMFKGLNEPWSVSTTFYKLKALSDRQKGFIDSEENLKKAIIGIVIQEQLLKEAKQLQLDSTDEFKKESARARNSYIISKIIEHIYENARPTKEQLEKYYNDHLSEFKIDPLFEISEIVIKDSTLATQIFSRISSGENFKNLAKQFSIRKVSASKGGYLGWGTPGQFGQLSTVLLNSEVGDIIGPTNVSGLYVIAKVLNREPSRQLSFEEARSQIEKALEFQTRRRAFITFRDALKSSASISIDSTLVKEFILN